MARPTQQCCGRTWLPESSPDDPVVLGEPDGSPIRHVLAVQHVAAALRRDQPGWATGSDVDAYLARGMLVLVTDQWFD